MNVSCLCQIGCLYIEIKDRKCVSNDYIFTLTDSYSVCQNCFGRPNDSQMFTNYKQNDRPKLVWYAELVLSSEHCKPKFRYTENVRYAEMSCKALYLMFSMNDWFWDFSYFPKVLLEYLGDYHKFLEYNILHLHDTLITIETWSSIFNIFDLNCLVLPHIFLLCQFRLLFPKSMRTHS